MKVFLVIWLLCFGLFSCEDDRKVVATEKGNEPYVYSDSLLNEYQKGYDTEFEVLNYLKNEVHNNYDSLIQQIDFQMSFEGDIFRVDFLMRIKESASLVLERSKQLNNFFVAETSFMIKHSGDENFGLDLANKMIYDHHYTENSGGYFEMLKLNNLKNKGDYKTSLNLYVGGKGFEAPKGLYLLDSLNQFKEEAYKVVISITDTIVMPVFDFMDAQTLILESLDKKAVNVFDIQLDDVFFKFLPQERAYLVNVFRYLTPPELVERNGEAYPWIAAKFDVPLIEAARVFLIFQEMILSAENQTYKYLLEKLAVD